MVGPHVGARGAGREQIRPGRFAVTIRSPRYVARYDYLQSTAASLLLDPTGARRFSSGNVYPALYHMAADHPGRTRHSVSCRWVPGILSRLSQTVP